MSPFYPFFDVLFSELIKTTKLQFSISKLFNLIVLFQFSIIEGSLTLDVLLDSYQVYTILA